MHHTQLLKHTKNKYNTLIIKAIKPPPKKISILKESRDKLF
jgi:hypothetical protein